MAPPSSGGDAVDITDHQATHEKVGTLAYGKWLVVVWDAACCCCSFGRKSSLRAAQGVVFARVPPPTLVLETPHTKSNP